MLLVAHFNGSKNVPVVVRSSGLCSCLWVWSLINTSVRITCGFADNMEVQIQQTTEQNAENLLNTFISCQLLLKVMMKYFQKHESSLKMLGTCC